MKHYYSTGKNALEQLIFQYEVMSQKGTVMDLEETVFYKLGQYYSSKGQISKALKVIQDGVRTHPISDNLLCLQAQMLLNHNLIEEAQVCLNQAESNGIHSFQLDKIRTQVFISQERYQEAMQLLDQLLGRQNLLQSEMAELYFLEALVFERMHLIDQMFDSLVDCLRTNAFHNQAIRFFSLAVDITRRFKEAIELYDYILHENPYDGETWNSLANIYCRTGNFEKAIECFEFAYHADPAWKSAYCDYADLQFEYKRYDRALQVYLELKDQFDDLENSEIEFKIGKCYLKLKDYTEARRHFFRALSLEQSDEYYFLLGTSYAEERNWLQAVYFFEEAIANGDDQCDHYYAALASTYYALGRFDRAEKCFYQATSIAPTECTYWVQYLSFLIQTSKSEIALQEVETAFEATVGTDLLYTKAVALFAVDMRSEALRTMELALREDFDLHQMIFDICPVLKQDKDIKAIIRYFRGEWEMELNQLAVGF